MKKNKKRILVIVFCILILSMPVYAGEIKDSKPVRGTMELIDDATVTAMIAAPCISALLCIYCFIRKGGADEMDKKKWSNRINTILYSLAGVFSTSAIINIIAHYYQ